MKISVLSGNMEVVYSGIITTLDQVETFLVFEDEGVKLYYQIEHEMESMRRVERIEAEMDRTTNRGVIRLINYKWREGKKDTTVWPLYLATIDRQGVQEEYYLTMSIECQRVGSFPEEDDPERKSYSVWTYSITILKGKPGVTYGEK